LWSKDSLERAIAEAQPIYAASLEQVTGEAESTIAVTTEGVEELKALEASLLAQVNAMGRAKSYIINQNAIQDALKEAIADGQATLDDPLNAAGDATLRAALQTAVSEGQALIDGISTTNQYD
jgi:anti-sigma28 factor (negative regulator of flagellin synthesis)